MRRIVPSDSQLLNALLYLPILEFSIRSCGARCHIRRPPHDARNHRARSHISDSRARAIYRRAFDLCEQWAIAYRVERNWVCKVMRTDGSRNKCRPQIVYRAATMTSSGPYSMSSGPRTHHTWTHEVRVLLPLAQQQKKSHFVCDKVMSWLCVRFGGESA